MLTENNYKPTLVDHCMKISNDKSLRPTLFGVLMLAAFAVSAGKTAGSAETAKSAKFPAPKIDGFWQASGAMRPVFVFGRHFQPAGATVPRVKIGGKASLGVQVISDDLLLVLPPSPQAQGVISVETRAGSPVKTVAQAASSAKLGTATKGVSINGIWPDQGPVGTFVFVFGSGYAPNQTQVTINQTPAALTQVLDQGLLIANVPTGTTSGAISVQTGKARAKSKIAFGVQ